MRSEAHQLTLDPLGDDAWRLCDRALATSDARSVIAYVERRPDGRYEVTWVLHGIATATYATLDELLSKAAAILSSPLDSSSGKPIPIPHRPPLALS